MATDYRFAVQCWQDSAGSENARLDVYINDVKVVDNKEITATSKASPQVVYWETTGLADPVDDGSVTEDIKFVLKNEYYVDSSTDRNIWIDAMGYTFKIDGATGLSDGVYVNNGSDPATEMNSDSEYGTMSNYISVVPTAVSGDQIPSDFWSSRSPDTSFYDIPVWGSDGVAGTTVTIELR